MAITRTLTEEEYWYYLIKKDKEELIEVKEAQTSLERKKELVDKHEVLRAMALYSGFTMEEIVAEADKKHTKNGGFQKRLLLIKTISKSK